MNWGTRTVNFQAAQLRKGEKESNRLPISHTN